MTQGVLDIQETLHPTKRTRGDVAARVKALTHEKERAWPPWVPILGAWVTTTTHTWGSSLAACMCSCAPPHACMLLFLLLLLLRQHPCRFRRYLCPVPVA